jgi:hypothetical protein
MMYAGDHGPPHVHFIANNGRQAVIYLVPFSIRGNLSVRAIKTLRPWLTAQHEMLLEQWRTLNP